MTRIQFKDYKTCLMALLYCFRNNIDVEAGTLYDEYLIFKNSEDAVMIGLRFS